MQQEPIIPTAQCEEDTCCHPTRLWGCSAAACSEAADAEAAAAVYQQMRAEGCQLDQHVIAALISAFSAAVRVRGASADRRAQLVLLERAFLLLDDMGVRRPHMHAVAPESQGAGCSVVRCSSGLRTKGSLRGDGERLKRTPS